MFKAGLKGAGLFVFGWCPGGARVYRHLTREVLGTKATHVDKLQRVLPGYVATWRGLCGLRMQGLRLWIHEPGWTPYWALAGYLLCGRAPVMTVTHARMRARYLARAVSGALATGLPDELQDVERRRVVAGLRWGQDVGAVVESLGGTLHQGVDPAAVPFESGSVDLVHTGGELEHLRPSTLRAFLRECRRVLRPGGVMSHVFDHRDHLHHADNRLPFGAHLALGEAAYRAAFGHELGYHNRLSPGDVQAMLEEEGFQPLALRRMALPAGRYLPDEEVLRSRPALPRRLLASRHRDISELDLRTAAAHYLSATGK